MKNAHSVLELDEFASYDELKRNFRRLCLKYHPDRPNGDSKKFMQVVEAYKAILESADKLKFGPVVESFINSVCAEKRVGLKSLADIAGRKPCVECGSRGFTIARVACYLKLFECEICKGTGTVELQYFEKIEFLQDVEL